MMIISRRNETTYSGPTLVATVLVVESPNNGYTYVAGRTPDHQLPIRISTACDLT